jgi:hypothetical protein
MESLFRNLFAMLLLLIVIAGALSALLSEV